MQAEWSDEQFAHQAGDQLSLAANILGSERTDYAIDLHVALTECRRQLSSSLCEGRIQESDIEDACRALVTIESLEEQCVQGAARRRASDLHVIHTAVGGLRDLASADMVQSAPGALCETLPFARAMISSISGSRWRPQRLHVQPEFDGSAMDFSNFVDAAEFPLTDAPLESELVRRRVPALVAAPAQDERTLKEIVTASQSSGYVAAPVVSGGRVIGLIHADRPGGHDALDLDDRDRLDTFATFFALVYEQSVLRERIVAQRTRLTQSYASTDQLLARLDSAVVGLRPIEVCVDDRVAVGSFDAPIVEVEAILTMREREILAHIATGATNGRIAQILVISEGTVKSHVKHILEKLRVPTRSAAAALYIHRTRR